jgi:hypothetical protein
MRIDISLCSQVLVFAGRPEDGSLVVEAGLQDREVITVDEVDQAMLLVESAGPGSS